MLMSPFLLSKEAEHHFGALRSLIEALLGSVAFIWLETQQAKYESSLLVRTFRIKTEGRKDAEMCELGFSLELKWRTLYPGNNIYNFFVMYDLWPHLHQHKVAQNLHRRCI